MLTLTSVLSPYFDGQVEQFLMSRGAGIKPLDGSLLNQPPQQQSQQQQYPGAMNHGGYSSMGGGMGNMGFPSLGGPDPTIGVPGTASQGAAMHAPGPGAVRVPGPIGPLHGQQVW